MRTTIKGLLGDTHGVEVLDADFDFAIEPLRNEGVISSEEIDGSVRDGEAAIIVRS